MPKFRTRYSAVCDTPGYSFHADSMTVQADFESTLIPNIINQHIPANPNPPMFGDFSDTPEDLAEAYARVEAAEERFMSLPSDVRARFGNDPFRLLEFLQDEGNRDEAVKLGLCMPRKPSIDGVTPSGAGLSDPPAPPPSLDVTSAGDTK